MARYKEESTYVKMRRNVRKSVNLKFKHYELRVKGEIETSTNKFESILEPIKMTYLKRWFIREEIIFELQKIKGVINADLLIEVFAVYGTDTSIGEYDRYLGELEFFVSGLDRYDKITYRHKNSLAYFQQPEKSDFIPKRL